MKKKNIVIISVILIFAILGAYIMISSNKKTTYTFSAILLENMDTYLSVTPDASSHEIRSSDKIDVSLKGAKLVDSNNKEIGKNDFKANNQIEITYDGRILETYPARIISTTKIKLIK